MWFETSPAVADRHPARAAKPISVVWGAVIGLYLAVAGFVAFNTNHGLAPGGAPAGYDFSAFYEAGRFAHDGHAADAYDDDTMIAAERKAFPGSVTRLPWNYPPSFQLLLMPFAALPYLAAFLLWSVTGFALYAMTMRAGGPAGQHWPMLLFSGAAINLLMGQNGLLTVAVIGGGVSLLRDKKLLGGVVLGFMTYKPHFAVLIPLALLCGREWRALSGFILSAITLSALSLAVLGIEPWLAFLDRSFHAVSVFGSSSSDWRTIPSVLVMARSLNLPPGLDSALHWTIAGLAALATAWIWRTQTDTRLRGAALATATLLITPYLRVYDLALLALPLAFLLSRPDIRTGRILSIAAWVLPAFLLLAHPAIQVGPLVTIALLSLIVRVAMRRPAIC